MATLVIVFNVEFMVLLVNACVSVVPTILPLVGKFSVVEPLTRLPDNVIFTAPIVPVKLGEIDSATLPAEPVVGRLPDSCVIVSDIARSSAVELSCADSDSGSR